MIFNSNVFLVFFLVVTVAYWLVRSRATHRDALIFAASLFFYGWWDWRFLGLLLATGAIDFHAASRISKTTDPRLRKRWLKVSLISNLGTLGLFKYAGFFLTSAAAGLNALGLEVSRPVLEIVLPAGISFYTFQALAYTIDVYRGSIQAEPGFVRYFAFLTFFPQLVAGPIERASFLLPQFQDVRHVSVELVRQGLWLICWGFFQKVVLADYLGPLVDLAFTTRPASLPVTLLGTLAFGGQIYCDFSGYSTIARGVANTLGFELSPNFAQPYLSTNIQEFWRRWHQTLSTWFRDYVYIPLGGDRAGSGRTFLNVVLTFTLAGLWHGANWTFVLWGLWHGLALGLYRIWTSTAARRLPGIPAPIGWAVTMVVVGIGWLFFRAPSFHQLWEMLASASHPAPAWTATLARAVALPVGVMLGLDLFHRHCPWSRVRTWAGWIPAVIQGTLLAAIVSRWGKEPSAFIYFQF